MAAAIAEFVAGAFDTTTKVNQLKTLLQAHSGEAQIDLVTALITSLGTIPPADGVRYLAMCMVVAKDALLKALGRGDVLAAGLYGAGPKASAVADLAATVLPRDPASAQVLEFVGLSMWPSLARLHGKFAWEDLPPSPARAGAVRLWTKRPELGPPKASAGTLALWLAQAQGLETEKPKLYSAVRECWQTSEASLTTQVEDAVGALLQRPGDAALSEQRMAEIAASEQPHGSSPWACCLFAQGVGAAAIQIAEPTLSSPAGRGALLLAWSALHAATVAAVMGIAELPEGFHESLQLLGDLAAVFAEKRCWQLCAAVMLCTVLRWPRLLTGTRTVLMEGLLRRVLKRLPEDVPQSPLSSVMPLILAAVPRADDGEVAADPLLALAQELCSSQSKPAAGLRNLGNTCYLNSFLQALALTESFVTDLLTLFPPLSSGVGDTAPVPANALPPKGAAVRRSLGKVLLKLSALKRSVSPTVLATMTPFGLRGQQQDVTELARWLLEQCGDAEVAASLTGRTFGISTQTTVSCASCGHQQARLESLADLCLPIATEKEKEVKDDAIPDQVMGNTTPRQLSVTHLLQAALAEEALPDYRCDGCGAASSSSKRMEVLKPPEHLILTLSRFAFTQAGGQEKLDVPVRVEQELQLPFASAAAGGGESYSLYAVVTHAGSTPHSGHYVCLGRASDKPDDAWRCFDDSSVRALQDPMTEDGLHSLVNGGSTAYVLLYRRVSGTRPTARRVPKLLVAEAVLEELSENTYDTPSTSSSSSGPAPASYGPSLGNGGGQDPGPGTGFDPGGGSWVC